MLMNEERRFAEEVNYWETINHPAKSQAEIIELLLESGR